MCGIVAIAGKRNVYPFLLEGLGHLEYRGYDSAGVATLDESGNILCFRTKGKLNNLKEKLKKVAISGDIGIGHTRWATHGLVNIKNSHPQITEKVAVVHNGTIENFSELREELEALGYVFNSETDSEVIPILISHYLDKGNDYRKSVELTLKKLEGTFALAIIFKDNNNVIIVARRGSPLAIGRGKEGAFAASDARALVNFSSDIIYLEDGDYAELSINKVSIYNQNNQLVDREVKKIPLYASDTGKGDYPHYMIKEIYEQPKVIDKAFVGFRKNFLDNTKSYNMGFHLKDIDMITIVACGTSYYAGMVGQYWLESIAKVFTVSDIASEFRYAKRPMLKNGLSIFISQSGETADTLAALNYAVEQKQHILSLVNVPESTIARASTSVIDTLAGVEIGVASTKSFTAQLLNLALLSISLAYEKQTISLAEKQRLLQSLSGLPSIMAEVLNNVLVLKEAAEDISKSRNVIYIGRGTSYPIALEGALKMKEISYIQVEAVAAGELKHGPIALIDQDTTVVAILPSDELFSKTLLNMQEIAARGGKIITITDGSKGLKKIEKISSRIIKIPSTDSFIAPMVYALPMQLLAYHTAVILGTDVDQPRNLAKSVTVE